MCMMNNIMILLYYDTICIRSYIILICPVVLLVKVLLWGRLYTVYFTRWWSTNVLYHQLLIILSTHSKEMSVNLYILLADKKFVKFCFAHMTILHFSHRTFYWPKVRNWVCFSGYSQLWSISKRNKYHLISRFLWKRLLTEIQGNL